ncbi:MAG: hypothetical protein ABI142_07835, partial [Bryocella sp.]
ASADPSWVQVTEEDEGASSELHHSTTGNVVEILWCVVWWMCGIFWILFLPTSRIDFKIEMAPIGRHFYSVGCG